MNSFPNDRRQQPKFKDWHKAAISIILGVLGILIGSYQFSIVQNRELENRLATIEAKQKIQQEIQQMVKKEVERQLNEFNHSNTGRN